MPPLTAVTLLEGVRQLAERDSDLAAIYERLGAPPLWSRAPGFATLIHIILEQQVSLASARAAFDRLRAAANPLTPERFLALDDDQLLAIGFSRQKRRYGRLLATAIRDGELNLPALAALDDATVKRQLTAVKGIGPWTADIYLLMALHRRDSWPAGDLALAKAARDIKSLPALPPPDELEALAEPWRPWRGVAARLLWHHYLNPVGKR